MTLEMGAEVTPKRQRLSRKKRRIYGPANQETRQGKLAPQILADAEKTFEKRRRPAPKVRSAEGGVDTDVLPRFSIGRPINRHALEASRWVDFLGHVEDVNVGLGEVAALGGIACEYINDESIKAMLGDKYPRAFSERDRATRILRDFARNFNRYAQAQTRAHQDAAFETATGPLHPAERMMQSGDDLYLLTDMQAVSFNPEGEYDDLEDDFFYDPADEGFVNWGHGAFRTGTVVNCGRLGMAVSLDYRAELDSEFNDITTYLRREEQLDTKLLVASYDDYAFSFEQRVPIFTRNVGVETMLRGMDIPSILPLHPPAARDITNFVSPLI